MPRVCLEYTYTLLTGGRSLCEAPSFSPSRRSTSPLPTDCESAPYGLQFLRYATILILLMVAGVNTALGATITYHIINLGRLDDNGQLTNTRTEALQFTVTDNVTVGVPDTYKSPLATNWKYYKSNEITETTINSRKTYTFAENTTLVEGTSTLSDGNHVYVTYEFDEDALSMVNLIDGGTCKINFYDSNQFLQQTVYQGDPNTGSFALQENSTFYWKVNIKDPYQITIQSKSTNYSDWYLSADAGKFGDIRLRNPLGPEGTAGTAKKNKVWAFGLLPGSSTNTYRLIVADGYVQARSNGDGRDDFGHGYLNDHSTKNNERKSRYQAYAGTSYGHCDLTFVPVTKNYIIVNKLGQPLVQALTEANTLEVPDVIKSPLASYTYYGTQQDAINEGTQLTSATGATIYVRYTTNNEVLNLKEEIKYNISVGGTNYLYASDATTLSSEATSENNANNTHKWILTGNDAYQIIIKNVGNSNEIAYNLSSSEAVYLSGTGSKFFFHQTNSGEYEMVAITSNDYSTPDYYTLGMGADNLKLYSNSGHPFGNASVQTVFTPRPMAAITTPPAANSLNYNGLNQELVTAGTASNGTMKYRLGDTGSYEETIPTAKDVNTYSVYYMAVGTDGYEDFFASEPIEVTINKQSIIVSGITASNKIYDGNTTATLVYTNATLTGKVGSEELTVSATGTFADKNVGTGKTVTISDLTLGGIDAGNYELAASGQQTEATANITAAEITVTGITAENKVYNGNTTATLVCTNATFTDKVDGDVLSVTATGTFADANVGTEKVVTISDLTLGGTDAGNYELAASGQQTEATADITAKALTITADSDTKVYDGTALTNDSYTNTELAAGDQIESVTVTGSQTNAGTSDNVPSAAVIKNSATDNVTANYDITYSNGTLEVTPKTLSITAEAKWKAYGEADPELTYTSEGLINDDAITGTLTREAGENAGVYAITLGELTAGNNYTISYTGADLTITKVGLTITANNKTIIYGDAPAGNGVTYDGFVNSETADVLGGTLAYDYNYAQYGDVGNTYTITPHGLTSNNYDISFVAGTLTVNPKVVGITWENTEFTYNGKEHAPTATATGLVNNDEIGVIVSGAQTNAGNYTATALALTGAKKGNYHLLGGFVKSFTILPKNIGDGTTMADGYTLDFGVGNTILLTDDVIGSTMVLDTDYEVNDIDEASKIYDSNKYSERTVTGIGNYTGSFDVRNVVISFTTDTDQEEWSATFAAEKEKADASDIGLALPEGVMAFIISGIRGEWAIPEPLNYIPAGVPVLLVARKQINGFVPVKAESGDVTLVTNDQKTKNMLEEVTASTSGYNPDTQSAPFTTKQIYLLYKNEFVFNKAGNLKKGKVYLNPNHTVSASPDPAPARLQIAWNNVTGIKDGRWKMEEGRSERWYTIDGRRLSGKPDAKGLYIVGGKKIVVR